jgi:periplasmic protein CpxP/Spy
VNKFVSRFFMTAVMSLFLCLSLGAFAQDQEQNAPPQQGAEQGGHGRRGMRGNPEQRLERLSKQLNLTDDQKAKIKPILDDEDAKMKALWQDTSTAPEDKRGKLMAVHQTANDQIKSLLTEDQQKKFSDMQERMHQRMKDRGGDNN